MAECFERWLTFKRLAHRAHPRSVEGFASASRRFSKRWGEVPAELGLSSGDVDRFKTERLAAGVIPSTVNNDLLFLRNALGWARRTGTCSAEVPDVTLLKVSRRRVPKFLAPRDVNALLEKCEIDRRFMRIAPYVQLATYAGMRRDEVRWLTWRDIDLDRGLIFVVEKRGRWSPKSFERTIDIDSELVSWLKSWRDRVQQAGCATVAPDWVAPFWCLGVRGGASRCAPATQWSRTWIGQEVRALFAAAGVERPRSAAHTLHMLRGTYAVRLLQGGADLETVRHLLGHVSIATTSVYLQATESSRRRALRGLRTPLE
jgi:integrase